MPIGPEAIPIFVPLGAFVMVMVIVWVASQEKQAKARYRAEVQRELIAKFGSGRELSEFLNSEGSHRLLGTIQGPEEDSSQDPRRKIIGLITGGIICMSIGAAFLLVAMSSAAVQMPFTLVGLIMTGVGGSLLLSAGISYYLSKKWGLDKPTGSDLPKSY